MVLFLVPYGVQSSFEISRITSKLSQARGVQILEHISVKAGVIPRCCVLPVLFSLHISITCQKRQSYIIS